LVDFHPSLLEDGDPKDVISSTGDNTIGGLFSMTHTIGNPEIGKLNQVKPCHGFSVENLIAGNDWLYDYL